MTEPSPRQRTLTEAENAELAAWLVEFGPGLRRYFSRRAKPADIDDLVQQVFLRLMERGAVDGGVANARSYLFTVASRVLISRYRHDAVRSALHDPYADPPVPIDSFDPERITIGRQEYDRMVVALGKLPPRAREAFILHRFDELSYGAIARRMGISLIGVRKLVGRAALRLAALMDGGE